jgi:hypothetical protein
MVLVQPSVLRVTGELSVGVNNLPGHKFDNTLLSKAEDKNEWSCTSKPSCAFYNVSVDLRLRYPLTTGKYTWGNNYFATP